MNKQTEMTANIYRDIVVKAWQDAAFKQRLLTAPKTVLSEAGIAIPATVSVHENTLAQMNFILPQAAEVVSATLAEIDPIVAQVVRCAAQDAKFKQRLLAEPKAAVQEATGVDVPEALSLYIHENTAEHLHLILPANPAESFNAELSDTELELVAGGKDDGAGSLTGGGCNAYSNLHSNDPGVSLGGAYESFFGAFVGYSWGWNA